MKRRARISPKFKLDLLARISPKFKLDLLSEVRQGTQNAVVDCVNRTAVSVLRYRKVKPDDYPCFMWVPELVLRKVSDLASKSNVEPEVILRAALVGWTHAETVPVMPLGGSEVSDDTNEEDDTDESLLSIAARRIGRHLASRGWL